jgi:hypothetical protein
MSVLFFWPTNQLAQLQLEIAADGELRARGKYDAGKEIRGVNAIVLS